MEKPASSKIFGVPLQRSVAERSPSTGYDSTDLTPAFFIAFKDSFTANAARPDLRCPGAMNRQVTLHA